MTRRRLFNIATLLSLLICLAMAPAWIISEQASLIPFPEGRHLAGPVRVRLLDGWVAFWNGNGTGPFTNVLMMSSGPGRSPPEIYWRVPGISFHLIKWFGITDWTFAISPAYPMLLSAILPAVWVIRRLRARRGAIENLCPACSYNLTGNVSGVCPECGMQIAPRKTG